MNEGLNKLVGHFTDPYDLAVFLGAATAGYLLDAGLDIIEFLDSGNAGLSFATGALGIKKGMDGLLAKWKSKRKAWNRSQHLRSMLENEPEKHRHLMQQLTREEQLFQSDIIPADDFEKSLNEIIAAFRASELNDGSEKPIKTQP